MTTNTPPNEPAFLTMRWFGPHDPVPLASIRQVPGVRGIVSALTGVVPGEPWPIDRVRALRDAVEAAELTLSVIESIAVSDEIKLARPKAAAHIDAWCRSLETVASVGVQTVCYNFMPVSDWVRTDLAMPLPDGSNTLAYDDAAMPAFEERVRTGEIRSMPAWDHVDFDRFEGLRTQYAARGENGLWDALGAFLERVTPVAESLGVRLAIHPDDPCWPVLGLPRIITSPTALERVCDLAPSRANGVTFCTGSLGCDAANDLIANAAKLARQVAFVHARNVAITAPRVFHETAHPKAYGDVDLPAVMRALVENGFTGPVRPDHGRMIWGETGTPGYGLFDRSLGAVYLRGILDTLG
jgi:mannonate dehydratase